MSLLTASASAIEVKVRDAREADAGDVARIYNEGIEERRATFETRLHEPGDFIERIAAGELVLVAERERVVGFAAVIPYSDRHYYAGIGEAMLNVERSARRAGVATELLQALAARARRRGLYKLIGKLFTSNAPSIGLVRRCGWREVGVHRSHGRLDGEWRDVLLVERHLEAEHLRPKGDE